jgi:hypothetical protein
MPWAQLAMMGASAVSGALSNRSRTTTSAPQWTPEQRHIQQLLGGKLENELTNPGAGLKPLKSFAQGRTNQNFDMVSDRMEKNLTARGFGRSGKLASRVKDVELSRANALSGIEADFAGKEMDQRNFLLQQMQQFGFASPGQQTTMPGNMAGGAISGGVETATLLYALSRLGGSGMGNT